MREFYSYHFGHDMRFSQANFDLRRPFLTEDLSDRLMKSADGTDPLTTGDRDIPKAFRVGECREAAAGRTELQVLLFWRDDVRSEQRPITVDAVHKDGRWLVADVKYR